MQASGGSTAAKQTTRAQGSRCAQVKLKEAEIATETADRMRQLADATASGASAAEGAAGSYDKLAEFARRRGQCRRARRNLFRRRAQCHHQPVRPHRRQFGRFHANPLPARCVGRGAEAGAEVRRRILRPQQGDAAHRQPGNADNAARLQKQAINDAVDKAIAAARKELQTGQAVDLGTSVNDLIARNNAQTPLRSLDDMISRIKNAGNEAKSQSIRVDLRTDRCRSRSMSPARAMPRR